MSEENTCSNCRHYCQHYVKNAVKLVKVPCGHCANHKVHHTKKHNPEVCSRWECMDNREESRKRTTKATLRYLAKQIEDIAIIYKDDIEN